MRALIALLALHGVAFADDEPPPPAPTPPPATPPTPTPADAVVLDPAEIADRLERLEEEQRRTAAALRRAAATHAQVQSLVPLARFITVFVDVGGFAVAGDGSGIRSDIDHLYFPRYRDRLIGQWVFMGDPLSTAINSNGDPADLSDSREIRGNNLGTQGHPSLIVNSLGLSIGKDVGHGIAVAALAELQPRPSNDRLEIELARIEYRPLDDGSLVISAGKIDSVLGIEYRAQDAPRRLGVTPSLICRYTCGRPIGVDARYVRGELSISAEVADTDLFVDRFEPHPTLHPNATPTAAGHVQWTFPVGDGLELGVSGAIGPQANQPSSSLVQWHLGFDARLRGVAGFDITAEYVQGRQPGVTMTVPCDLAPCLHYKGGYVLVDHRMNAWLTPYVRADWRDAVHTSGAQFIYEGHILRATLGARFAVTSRILAKLEYTFNRELGGIPQFPDDILTSSLVVATD